MSYTQQLEARVLELESVLHRVASEGTHELEPSAYVPDIHKWSRSIHRNPAAIENLAYSSSTSLFEPLTDVRNYGKHAVPGPEGDRQRRERLVQNAWKQRSLEILAQTPVSAQHFCDVGANS